MPVISMLGVVFYLLLLGTGIYAFRRRSQWFDPARRPQYVAAIMLGILIAFMVLIGGTLFMQNQPRGGW